MTDGPAVFDFPVPCPFDTQDPHEARQTWDPDMLQMKIDAGTLEFVCVRHDHRWLPPDSQLANLRKQLSEWRLRQLAARS